MAPNTGCIISAIMIIFRFLPFAFVDETSLRLQCERGHERVLWGVTLLWMMGTLGS